MNYQPGKEELFIDYSADQIQLCTMKCEAVRASRKMSGPFEVHSTEGFIFFDEEGKQWQTNVPRRIDDKLELFTHVTDGKYIAQFTLQDSEDRHSLRIDLKYFLYCLFATIRLHRQNKAFGLPNDYDALDRFMCVIVNSVKDQKQVTVMFGFDVTSWEEGISFPNVEPFDIELRPIVAV